MKEDEIEDEVDVKIRLPHWRHDDDDDRRKPPHNTRSIKVAIVLLPGKTLTGTATALEADGATADPNATITWAVDNAAVATVSPTDGGTTTLTAVAAGAANVTATATDPDGNTVASAPFAVTVADTSTDAKSVTVTFA